MDPRAINFNVLRRHDPRISSILDSTSYAVIYRYFHGAWSKTGFEGTLFIFQRDTHPFNGVFVLNRQGLDNLCEGLLAGWDVDLDEGLIIWRSAGATGDADDDVIYGIWVYEEKDRARIATTMQELINGVPTQQPLQQPSPSPPPVSLSHPVPRVPIISAGQSISLDQLFGVGSVCSEPPPQTSALPHPGTSVLDPEEQQDNFLPAKMLSPDASDLPKGMQLLDSLFQKAAIKSQNSHQQQPSPHSPNGPRPQMDSGHHHSPKNPPSGSPSSAQPMPMSTNPSQTSGPVFSTSVWPFNKIKPVRALSPLNPARQTPSNFNHPSTRGTAAGNHRQPHNDHHHHHRNLPPTQTQRRHLLDHSPPQINDSSRPIKPDSYGSSINNSSPSSRPIKPDYAGSNNAGLNSPNVNHVKVAPVVNPKLAVESLDELLILDASCSKMEKSLLPSDLNHLNQSDSAPLDKSQFVNGILNLINVRPL